ncbi:carbohydrate ABC transporter permease [Clostridium neonatale]|uniref:Predicted beta-xyloside ABC transporter, permease component n=1 Tax=Clostridium neonatale TaxID=137838 RepID=A0AA86JPQ7_9CLOT|nr:sugar ABC transporter permease [Clostridium neonatale]MBP8314290.1 sugar ABC transporter permease [Clostridium neonatale]CAG9706916.1 Predicted beta-xyloside ABC transporter, permease component [Clostridium neonatale]CAI3547007.1 raffinose/stachyose/melibiose transport system permease protein [Clostridium neonatale]CAI3552445.1 raffinose/stachyose/melibiose transport system permease protein [Clostridium neonatale]CAI3568871.1 raffinose/stachyose/melibiose transport system permease protein [
MNSILSNKKIICIFVLPTLIIMSAIVFIPIILSVKYSMFDWGGVGTGTFIGLENYKNMFMDMRFLHSVKNSLLFAVVSIVIQLPISLLLALILASGVKFEKFYRTVYFIPVIISTVVIGQLWIKIYNADYGLLNTILRAIGQSQLAHDWLGKEDTALISCFIPILWQYVGYHMLIMYAGAKSISSDINEAAKIDGASPIKTAFYITIPLLKPILKVCMTFSLIGALKVFDLIYVLTNSGPFFSTEVPSTLMYTTIFDNYKYGYGSAISVFIIIECLILTVILDRVIKTE